MQVGVVYLKEYQSSEEEIFSNLPDSSRFEDFLRLLGKRYHDLPNIEIPYDIYEPHKLPTPTLYRTNTILLLII